MRMSPSFTIVVFLFDSSNFDVYCFPLRRIWIVQIECLGVGVTTYWITTTIDGIVKWYRTRWYTFTSRRPIWTTTIAELTVINWNWSTKLLKITQTINLVALFESQLTITLFVSFNWNRRTGSPLVRTPSPRRRSHLHPNHDIGFSDTVSNVVEIVKEDYKHRGYRSNGRYPRGS